MHHAVKVFLPSYKLGQITEVEIIPEVIALWKPPAAVGGEFIGYAAVLSYADDGVRKVIVERISDPEQQWLIPASLPQQRPVFFQVYMLY